MLPRYGTIASAASLVLFGKCLSDEYSKYLFLRSGVSFEKNLDTVDISFCDLSSAAAAVSLPATWVLSNIRTVAVI